MPSTKHYLTIKQVSEITGIPPYTLRFWEKEFEGILAPSRTIGGQRRFAGEDISVIESIKRFKDQGISLNMIKEKLADRDGKNDPTSIKIDLLAKRVAEIVKEEISYFLMGEGG